MTSPTSDVRDSDQLDWVALERYLREHLAELDLPAAAMTVRQFTGGRANLTYRVSFADHHLVIRRPPHGVIAPGAHDMAREGRVLARLGQRFSPAPTAFHFCADPAIVGTPFVVIEYRDGVVIDQEIPASMSHHADVTQRVDLALVDAAAKLHLVDPAAVDLADLGQPEGFAERQVSGWTNRWTRVAASALGEGTNRRMTEVGDALLATLPRPQRVSIVHNDLKLDNCQFQPDDPDTVTSIFDWDMTTLGDPLFDIAVMITSMRTMPAWTITTDQVAERYAARTGLDVSGLNWYLAFATWRTATVLQQLYARFAAGDSGDTRLQSFGELVPELAERAVLTLSNSLND